MKSLVFLRRPMKSISLQYVGAVSTFTRRLAEYMAAPCGRPVPLALLKLKSKNGL